nr:urea active transporter protein [Hymenolepis microstoma]
MEGNEKSVLHCTSTNCDQMEELVTESFMLVYPSPGITVNLTRVPLTPDEQTCRNLQSSFRVKKRRTLRIGDVATIACGVLVVIITVDIICTLLTRRKHHHDRGQNADITNSNGKNNLGIVVVSFTAQITRPLKILECVSYAYRYGVYGCIFSPTNSALTHTFFVLLLLEFRTKAPGAQTIAQFVRSRFGPIAHILTIVVSLMTSVYALMINVSEGSMVMVAATDSVSRTVVVSMSFILVGALLLMRRRKSIDIILCFFVLTILCIASFLISIAFKVASFKPLGSIDSFYKLLLCFKSPERGFERPSIMGVYDKVIPNSLIDFVHNIVRVFLDQVIWETSINLPPNHGIIGLLLAILMSFCIPVAFGIVCGLGFRALESAFFNERLLNETQINSGLMIFAVPVELLDKVGIVLIFLVILLVLVISCMFAISGASSILYYDVLATYIKPFKKHADSTTCLLCGKRRGHLASQRNICRCRSTLECADCQADTQVKDACRTRPSSTIVYGCRTHGAYRAYTDQMASSVLQIAFTIMAGMIPIFIMFDLTAIINNIYFGLCSSFIGCLCLCITWNRLTKIAFLVGYFVNSAITVVLVFALENVPGLYAEYSSFVGLSVGIIGGFLLPISITLITTRPLPPEVALSVWISVQEIDNPLVPWPEVFTRQTDLRFSPRLSEKKPALGEVRRALASLRQLTCGLVILYVIIFFGLWHILGFSLYSLDFVRFYFFVGSIELWTYFSSIFCLIFPLLLQISTERSYLRAHSHQLRLRLRQFVARLRRGRPHAQ